MGKPEIVEVYKVSSDDNTKQSIVTFGETEDEWYKVNMYEKDGDLYYWLYVKSLEEAIAKSEDFVGKNCAV